MKKLIFFILVVGLGFVAYLFLKDIGLTKVRINDATLKVEIADEKEELEKGLMKREVLKEDRGMLFVYENEIVPVFWMKNTLIPLDMIFISADKTINHLEKNVPLCNEKDAEKCPTYTSPAPSQYILEVNAGYSEKNQLKVGDKVEFEL